MTPQGHRSMFMENLKENILKICLFRNKVIFEKGLLWKYLPIKFFFAILLVVDFSNLLRWIYDGRKFQQRHYLLKLRWCNVGSKTGNSLVSLSNIIDQKCSWIFWDFFFPTVKLKSLIKIVLSYGQVNWTNIFDRWWRKYFSFWDGSL